MPNDRRGFVVKLAAGVAALAVAPIKWLRDREPFHYTATPAGALRDWAFVDLTEDVVVGEATIHAGSRLGLNLAHERSRDLLAHIFREHRAAHIVWPVGWGFSYHIGENDLRVIRDV